MKLKEFLTLLNDKVKGNPEILEYTVVSASDEEGNSFSEVLFAPTTGMYIDGPMPEFVQQGDENTEDYVENFQPNAICIN
jgi:hypothetical protein